MYTSEWDWETKKKSPTGQVQLDWCVSRHLINLSTSAAVHRFWAVLISASHGYGLGGVLSQHQDGQDRVISYASRRCLSKSENYHTHKLEFWALKWAVTDKFHDYLFRSRFTVRTDNNLLTYHPAICYYNTQAWYSWTALRFQHWISSRLIEQ